MKDTTKAALDFFKAQESFHSEVVHPLIRDPILRNLVVAWTTIPVTFNDPKIPDESLKGNGNAKEDENRRWKNLWTGVDYDREELATALRIDEMKVMRLVDRASAFRLIYPDGTANELAVKYVRAEISKSLNKKPGPRGKE